MMSRMTVWLFFPLVVLGVVACGGRTPEEEIRDTVGEVIKAAEAKDPAGVIRYISVDYLDEDNRDYAGMNTLINRHLTQYEDILISVLDYRDIAIADDSATTIIDAALSSGGAKLLRKLMQVSARLLRFQIGWKREGETWRVIQAGWEEIESGELSTGAIRFLRELFPD